MSQIWLREPSHPDPRVSQGFENLWGEGSVNCCFPLAKFQDLCRVLWAESMRLGCCGTWPHVLTLYGIWPIDWPSTLQGLKVQHHWSEPFGLKRGKMLKKLRLRLLRNRKKHRPQLLGAMWASLKARQWVSIAQVIAIVQIGTNICNREFSQACQGYTPQV